MMRKFFLILTSLFLVLCLCMTACSGLTIRENGDGSYTVTPNRNEGDDTQNNQPGNNQGSTDKPTAPDYSMYSLLLQEVLNDPQWDALYSKYESNELFIANDHIDVGTNLLEAIPYDFLMNKGEDVAGIKDGSVAVGSYLYVIDNDKTQLYDKINVIYRPKDKESYINQYLLKYRITEQELNDLKTLYSGRFYQGPIMFQCLAAKQQPEVISEFSITENGYKNILNNCNNANNYIAETLNYNQIVSCSIISLTPTIFRDKDAYDAIMYLFEKAGKGTVSSCELYQIKVKLLDYKSKVTYDNGIMNLVDLNALEPNLISSTPITYFQLENAFKDFKDRL